jgi:hypothetical protein
VRLAQVQVQMQEHQRHRPPPQAPAHTRAGLCQRQQPDLVRNHVRLTALTVVVEAGAVV